MFPNVGIFLDNMAIRIDCVHHDLLSKKANESIGAYLLSESVSIGTLVGSDRGASLSDRGQTTVSSSEFKVPDSIKEFIII
jgi:hypothetical protein